jgi:transposase
MPRQSPYRIVLSASEERTLTARAAQYTRPYFEVLRAKMILLAAEGWSNEAIAGSLQTRREVVSLWRKRFFERRLAGLEDHSRPGRPRAFSPRGRRDR